MTTKRKEYEEYEETVKSIVAAIFAQTEGVKPEERHGRANKVKGQSGYEHQIDVSVNSDRDWLLVECKCWKRAVSVSAFLAFLARIIDIRPTQPSRNVYASLVTTKHPQRGVKQLAEYYRDIYNIRLDVVRSPAEFAIKYKHLFAVGIADNINGWSDDIDIKLDEA